MPSAARKIYLRNPLKRGFSAATIRANIKEMIESGAPQKQSIAIALKKAREAYRRKHPRGRFPQHLKLNPLGIAFKTGPNTGQAGYGKSRGVVSQRTKAAHVIATPGKLSTKDQARLRILAGKEADRRRSNAGEGGRQRGKTNIPKFNWWKALSKTEQDFIDQQLKPVQRNPVKGRNYRKAVALYKDFHGEHPKHIDDWDVLVPSVALQVGKVSGIMYRAMMDGKMQEFLHEFTGKSQPVLAASADGRQLLLLGGDYKFTERGIVDGSYSIER